MKAIIFTNLNEAQACNQWINTKFGLPKEGTNIGGGYHADPSETATQNYTDIVTHPDGDKFGLVSDDAVIGFIPELIKDNLLPPDTQATELTPDWFPADPLIV